MNRIGQIGITWRNGGAKALAGFTVPVEERSDWLLDLARRSGAKELVYLATCNRVELVFASDGKKSHACYHEAFLEALFKRHGKPDEIRSTFQIRSGESAAMHLFLVASGLDSARIGESEIIGQVHDAYRLSRDLGLTGPRLDLLFEEAFKVAKRVHTRSSIGEGRQSLAEIALDHIRARLRRTPGPVAVVGVSAMTKRCARALSGNHTPIYVVNRTLERAEVLAQEIGGEARSLEQFRSAPDPVEAVVLATGAPGPVLEFEHLERLAARSPSGQSPLIVDMSISPDVLSIDAEKAGLERVGMEEILEEAEQNRERRLVEAADARRIVNEALVDLHRRMIDRILAPLFAAVQRRFRNTAVEGVERLFRKELNGLGEEQREVVRRWAETLARRFAHLPTAGLRGIAVEIGPEAVEAFLAQADESMIKILHEASQNTDLLAIPKGKGSRPSSQASRPKRRRKAFG